jgi:hypothetical protein
MVMSASRLSACLFLGIQVRDLPVERTHRVHIDGLFAGFERVYSGNLLKALLSPFFVRTGPQLNEVTARPSFTGFDHSQGLNGSSQTFDRDGWIRTYKYFWRFGFGLSRGSGKDG